MGTSIHCGLPALGDQFNAGVSSVRGGRVMTHWNCGLTACMLSLAATGEEADHGAGAAVPPCRKTRLSRYTPEPLLRRAAATSRR